jgi:hypothetical protein
MKEGQMSMPLEVWRDRWTYSSSLWRRNSLCSLKKTRDLGVRSWIPGKAKKQFQSSMELKEA